jgi:predicted PurR-regulated permease PerM
MGTTALVQPSEDILDKAPKTFRKLERRMRGVRQSFDRLADVTRRVTEIAETGKAGIKIQRGDLQKELLQMAQSLLGIAVTTLVLLFFMLHSGHDMLVRIVKTVPQLRQKKRIVAISQRLGRDVSSYLWMVTVINAGLGLFVGLAMWVTGMPGPLIWGIAAFLLNFVPYVGALLGVSAAAVVGIVTFPALQPAVTPALAYLALTTMEGYFVTPAILGKRLPLDPIAIVIGLIFWSWIWGAPGAFLAVPLMVCIKTVCDHFSRSAWIGALIGRVEPSRFVKTPGEVSSSRRAA